MLQLKNNTKSTSKIGFAVTIDPKDSHAFLYAIHGSSKVIGIITESVPYRSICKIATTGEKANVYVSGNIVKGDILRLSKTTDRASLGASVVAKSGDAPYVRIGEALNPGRGLISCVLDFNYLQSDGDTITWDDITGKPTEYPNAYRAINAIRTLDSTDYQIECTANTFTVTLPTAVGIEGRVYSIKNTGTGTITVDGNAAETIDGALTQLLSQWDNLKIMSNNANWIII